jgi:hypothetical protein
VVFIVIFARSDTSRRPVLAVAAAADQQQGDDQYPYPVVVKKTAKTIAVHITILRIIDFHRALFASALSFYVGARRTCELYEDFCRIERTIFYRSNTTV